MNNNAAGIAVMILLTNPLAFENHVMKPAIGEMSAIINQPTKYSFGKKPNTI